MTELVATCAHLRIGVDTMTVYDGDDPNYIVWLDMIVELVNQKRRAEAAKTQGK